MSYNTLIHSARVVDGSGNPWFYGDVALSGETIAAIAAPGAIAQENAKTVVDGSGHVVCPGFIDIQSHSILPLMIDGRCLSKITQGVTTEIMGEAWTPAPYGGQIGEPLTNALFSHGDMERWRERMRTWSRFGDWFDAMMAHGVSPNIGSYLGGGTLRKYAKGMEMGQPSKDEMSTMRRIMHEAMEDGAFGVSYALIYPPDAYTSTSEIVEICKVVGEHGGHYITHLRSEADAFVEATEEAFEIGRRANVPVEIYHLKASGRKNWPLLDTVVEMIDAARASGLDVTADMYPYAGSGTGLTAVLPPFAAAGGSVFDNLRDADMRARIRQAAVSPDNSWEAMALHNGPEAVMPIGFQKEENQQYVGKRLSEIAESRGEEWVDTVINLLLSEEQRISTIYFTMNEEQVRQKLRLPWNKISTDAGGYDPAWAEARGPVHPRGYGTYPRVLGRYVREEGVLTLEEAIRKMTSSVADRLRLRHRGLLREGMQADVVLFDPDTIIDRATFEQPHQLAEGVREVWVNGTRVVENGVHTGSTPGQTVRLR